MTEDRPRTENRKARALLAVLGVVLGLALLSTVVWTLRIDNPRDLLTEEVAASRSVDACACGSPPGGCYYLVWVTIQNLTGFDMTPSSLDIPSGVPICPLNPMGNGAVCVWGARGTNYGTDGICFSHPLSGTDGKWTFTLNDSAGTVLSFLWDVPFGGGDTFQPGISGELGGNYGYTCDGCDDRECGLNPPCTLRLTFFRKGLVGETGAPDAEGGNAL